MQRPILQGELNIFRGKFPQSDAYNAVSSQGGIFTNRSFKKKNLYIFS